MAGGDAGSARFDGLIRSLSDRGRDSLQVCRRTSRADISPSRWPRGDPRADRRRGVRTQRRRSLLVPTRPGAARSRGRLGRAGEPGSPRSSPAGRGTRAQRVRPTGSSSRRLLSWCPPGRGGDDRAGGAAPAGRRPLAGLPEPGVPAAVRYQGQWTRYSPASWNGSRSVYASRCPVNAWARSGILPRIRPVCPMSASRWRRSRGWWAQRRLFPRLRPDDTARRGGSRR